MIEMLTALYFIFFLGTNFFFFKICEKVMDSLRFGIAPVYIAAVVNAVIFTVIVYGFNQNPLITYLMVFTFNLIDLFIFFKNNVLGRLMYTLLATIYLVCVESIVISSGALLLNLSIAEITHNHQFLFVHIVISWFICMIFCAAVYALVPSRFLKLINQSKEQILFVLAFLIAATIYLTFNTFIYANSDTFDPIYLPLHQIIAPLTWLGVITLSIALVIRFDFLHDYKLKNEILERAIEEKMSELIESRNQAELDPLVGVYNKMTTQAKIEEELEKENIGAFFILDIDDFKNINDSKGHPYGDKVLIFLSKRIKNIFREHDIVGRIGGDEFVIFLKNTTAPEIIASKAHDLCKDINVPFANGRGDSVKVSISIGIAITPKHGKDFDILYKNADTALYESKRKGKNTYSIYND